MSPSTSYKLVTHFMDFIKIQHKLWHSLDKWYPLFWFLYCPSIPLCRVLWMLDICNIIVKMVTYKFWTAVSVPWLSIITFIYTMSQTRKYRVFPSLRPCTHWTVLKWQNLPGRLSCVLGSLIHSTNCFLISVVFLGVHFILPINFNLEHWMKYKHKYNEEAGSY